MAAAGDATSPEREARGPASKKRINGFEMFYEVAGGGFSIAFVPGGFGGVMSTLSPEVHPWLDRFARRYRVITYHRRGTGRSGYPDGGYSLENFARDLRGLLDHLGIERSHVIGDSSGGPIAIAYALAYPETVKGLVLASTATRLFREGAPSDDLRERVALLDREGKEAAYDAPRSPPPLNMDAFIRARLLAATPEELAESRERHEKLQRLIRKASRKDRVRWYAGETRNYAAFLRSDLDGRLSELAMPVFIIHGEADSIVPVAGGRRLHEGIPGSELRILPGAEHGLMNNEDAQSAILDFLARLDEAG